MPTHPPRVSVIIPTYKRADLVLSAVRSVLDQSTPPYEIVVVNDGSPDDTHQRLKPLADAGNIRYLSQENAGQSAARNRGFAASSGEYVAFLDDDDLFAPGKLAWQIEALHSDPNAALVYGTLQGISGAGGTLADTNTRGKNNWWIEDGVSGDVWGAFARKNRIISPGQCLIRRDALLSLGDGPLDNSLWGCEDHDLWLRLSARYPFRFEQRPALYYRLHDTNASRDQPRLTQNTCRMCEKLLAQETDPGRRESLRRLLRSSRDSFAFQTLRAVRRRSAPRPTPEMIREAWKYVRPRVLLRLLKVILLEKTGAM